MATADGLLDFLKSIFGDICGNDLELLSKQELDHYFCHLKEQNPNSHVLKHFYPTRFPKCAQFREYAWNPLFLWHLQICLLDWRLISPDMKAYCYFTVFEDANEGLRHCHLLQIHSL